MATIRDISRKSGFSISTVSHALNNRPRVSKETRKQIMKIAEELNYVPNNKAISLSLGRSNNIGIIIPYTKPNIYYDSIINSIISECFSNDYRPTFLSTNYNKNKELDYLKLFAAKEFDGLIITSATNSYKVIERYLKYGSIVSCEHTGKSKVPFVVLDREQVHLFVINKLLKRGIEKMACTFSRKPFSSIGSTEVFKVFENNVPKFTEEYTFSNCRDYQDGINAATYFYSFDPLIECIFANSDEIAAGMFDFYSKNKISPSPIIIGQNNNSWSKALKFSSIDFHLELLGAKAVQLCLSRDQKKILVKSEYIERT